MRGPRAVSRLILALTPTWFATVPAVVGMAFEDSRRDNGTGAEECRERGGTAKGLPEYGGLVARGHLQRSCHTNSDDRALPGSDGLTGERAACRPRRGTQRVVRQSAARVGG